MENETATIIESLLVSKKGALEVGGLSDLGAEGAPHLDTHLLTSKWGNFPSAPKASLCAPRFSPWNKRHQFLPATPRR